MLDFDRLFDPDPLHRLDNSQTLNMPFTVDDVKHFISKLKNKTPGPSSISSALIKHLLDNVIRFLTSLYNISLATGYFPNAFKITHVILIPKPT